MEKSGINMSSVVLSANPWSPRHFCKQGCSTRRPEALMHFLTAEKWMPFKIREQKKSLQKPNPSWFPIGAPIKRPSVPKKSVWKHCCEEQLWGEDFWAFFCRNVPLPFSRYQKVSKADAVRILTVAVILILTGPLFALAGPLPPPLVDLASVTLHLQDLPGKAVFPLLLEFFKEILQDFFLITYYFKGVWEKGKVWGTHTHQLIHSQHACNSLSLGTKNSIYMVGRSPTIWAVTTTPQRLQETRIRSQNCEWAQGLQARMWAS